MQVQYQLDTAQLDSNFIESIKALFGEDRKIEITVKDEEKSRDDTEYLLSNLHNAKRLMKSIENIEKNKDKSIFSIIDAQQRKNKNEFINIRTINIFNNQN